MSIFIKNPYIYTSDDFIPSLYSSDEDLVDSSGFLPLKDQISIIMSQSEINNEFRRGIIDRYNEDKEMLIQELSAFEENDYVNSQLLKSRAGDLIDKSSILADAYNAGYRAGFFPQNPDRDLGETPHIEPLGENESVDTTNKQQSE